MIISTGSSSDVMDIRGDGASAAVDKCSYGWHHFKLTLTGEVLQLEVDNRAPYVVSNKKPLPKLHGTVWIGGSGRGN